MGLDQWLGIELRHLAALQAVADEGTFRGAAARLGYTQSAISQQIATLEKIVGAKLVERPGGPRAVSLTETGRLVLRHAEAIIARLQAAQADVATMLDGGAGTLRVGPFQSAGARILPELVRRDLDLSFVMPPLPDGPFAITELLRDPWVLLVPADSPLAARRQPVSLRDVADLPLIGSRLCRSREQLNSHFRARGLSPTYVFESDENTTVHGLVAAGAGVAITPKLAVNPNDERVAVIELGPKVPPRVIAIAWHRDRHRSPAAAAFVELAKELCVELEPSAGTALAAAG